MRHARPDSDLLIVSIPQVDGETRHIYGYTHADAAYWRAALSRDPSRVDGLPARIIIVDEDSDGHRTHARCACDNDREEEDK